MSFRTAARDQVCIVPGCGNRMDVVGCHYTGVRRLAYGGGLGKKVSDVCIAHMCADHHREMDTLSRDKESRWEHSERFQHYILLTLIRLEQQGLLHIGERIDER